MEAYEAWLGGVKAKWWQRIWRRGQPKDSLATGRVELAILRLLGLFDRPATPDCLGALRAQSIAGITDAIEELTDVEWNLAVKRLVRLGLVVEQGWEARPITGYSEAAAKRVIVDKQLQIASKLGKPKRFTAGILKSEMRYSLDTHPLIREYFATQLRAFAVSGWQAAHSLLFDHLSAAAPYWPEGLESLDPLYQAIVHGCEAGRFHAALVDIFYGRIQRQFWGGPYTDYTVTVAGAIGANLAALSCFFVSHWDRPVRELPDRYRGNILNGVGYFLRACGRLVEAREALYRGKDLLIKLKEWNNGTIASINLSEVELSLNGPAAAIHHFEMTIALAKRLSDDSIYVQQYCAASYANALHQEGKHAEATRNFEDAEEMQRRPRQSCPWLNGLEGFWFCELLLATVERAVWKITLSSNPDARNDSFDGLRETCVSVEKRAFKTLKWFQTGGFGITSPIKIGVNYLTLGRIALYRSILEKAPRYIPTISVRYLEAAVHQLREAGQLEHYLQALLTRAWSRARQGQTVAGLRDFAEAQQVAERGPLRLSLVDIHLHRARLLRDKEDLKRARSLIEQCGYWRRKQELEDAEEAAKEW